MPAPTTAEEFLDLLRRSNVLPAKRLEDYLRDMTTSPDLAPKRLAKGLVRDGLLTFFQADQLMQGKWRGFTLGKYRILEKLGAGGMGAVFLCEHSIMNHRVAVKVLPAARAKDPASLGRFHREARAAAGLDHPNIVRAFDVDQDGDRHFLVMEYVDGTSLQELVGRSGPLEVRRAAHYVSQAAAGLQRAHEAGLVHRDVKPGNILVDRAGQIKVADLGLARFFHEQDDSLTREHDGGAILGSADYFAPEQALNSHDVDIRADIYALGCTLYFLLTGRPPFQEGTVMQKLLWHQMRPPQSVMELRPDVPPELARVLDRMMAKGTAERYQTPDEVVLALAPWTEPPPAPPTEADFRRLSPAAQGSGSGDTRSGPGSTRTKVTPPPTKRMPVGTATKAGAGQAQAFAWDQLDGESLSFEVSPADTTTPERKDSATRDEHTGPLSLRERLSPRRRPALVAAAGVAAALLLIGVWWGVTRAGRPAAKENGDAPANGGAGEQTGQGGVRLSRTSTGTEEGFDTLVAALTKAEPGDRITVRAETLDESLSFKGDGKTRRNVTIEGKTASGGPVVWRPAEGHGKEQPLLTLSDAPGLRLTGFVLDGLGRVDDLLVLSGRCGGLTLDGLEFRGFLQSAVKLQHCGGEPHHPVVLAGVSAAAGQGAESALVFEGRGSQPNQHVEVRDGRFVGPFKAAVRVSGPLEHTTFTRNRFLKGADAFRFHKATPSPRLHAAIAANTFCDFEAGLHWEGVPPGSAGNFVAVRDNLFLRTRTLATTDGVRTQPAKTPAQWVWSGEPTPGKGAAAPEARFFRKTFEVPKGFVSRATLDIACDDDFTVWLNGQQVGRNPFDYPTGQVHGHDVPRLLRPGTNVLAVQVTERTPPPGGRLLTQISYTVQGQAPVTVGTDSTWRTARKAPQGWLQPAFVDAKWAAVKVLGAYDGADGRGLVWDSAVQDHQPATLWQRVFAALGNVHDGMGREGFPALEARRAEVSLHADPTDDSRLLRYALDSPLASAGTGRGPVGVPPPCPPPAPATVWHVTRDGKEMICRSVRDALLRAKAGERVVVRGELLEESLALDGKDAFVGNITLEGQPAPGKAVLWRVSADHADAQPLVKLSDLAGLTVRGFLLDGRDRVDDLVVLNGYCPGVVLDDVHLRGFRRTGLVLRDCTGLQNRPVLLQRLRVTTALGNEAALSLEAEPGRVNRSIRVHDCRFEGPFQAAVRLAAPVIELDLQRNRFHRAVDGVLYKSAGPRHALQVTLLNNTFLDVNRIVHFETLPAGEPTNQIVMRDNLFGRPNRLVEAEGFDFEPKTCTANWIWSPEAGDLLKGAPVGTGYFRKSFNLPKSKVTAAVLNIICDDSHTVWLNGTEVAKGQLVPARRVVAAVDVVKHLRPGKNVLAVEGRNLRGVAGLLAQLTWHTADKKERHIDTDATWLASKEGPTGWHEPDFADSAWLPARVVTAYAMPHTNWRFLIWQSRVEKQAGKVLWPLLSTASIGNVSCRGAGVGNGYSLLEAANAGTHTSLGIDPDQDATYLRYPRGNPLAQAGANKAPVGVPPSE